MKKPGRAGGTRVCACVLMNHPFPANLPLLRRIYRERFSEVRFLIPFERMPDEPDVITVYRGSYNHATYLTDAQNLLSAIDCDYYMVIQDDVLLNPQIAEVDFLDTFTLGPDDGFIAWADRTQEQIGRCAWHFGFVSRFLHPKSMLFGSGVEPETLARYLPKAEALGVAIAASGISATSATRFAPDEINRDNFGHAASRILLHGLSADLDEADPAQGEIEGHSVEAERRLIQAMLATQRYGTAPRVAAGDDMVALPIPTVTGNYFADFYILPKSGFGEFCHLIGVAGAANLFVEIMAPTLLFACCARVRTADELGIDFSGFVTARALRWFEDPRHVAIHPFKLSQFRRSEHGDALVEALRVMGRGQPMPRNGGVSRAAFGRWSRGFIGLGEGWHDGEDWGVWSSAIDAAFPIDIVVPGSVRVELRTPIFPLITSTSGRLSYNGGSENVRFQASAEASDTVVILDDVRPDADGVARIVLHNDVLFQPNLVDAESQDQRQLGFGLLAVSAVPSRA